MTATHVTTATVDGEIVATPKKPRKPSGPRIPVPTYVFVRILDADGNVIENPKLEMVGSVKVMQRADVATYTKLVRERASDPTIVELSLLNGVLSVVG